MTAVLSLLVVHWTLSIFAQTFFLHRYGAHRMFTMSPGWERFFYLLAYLAQGPSFLVPRAYAILHRQHHTFADTEQDPHSPRFFSNVMSMMWHTKHQYDVYAYRRGEPEARFLGGTPEWPLIDRLSQRWSTRVAWALLFAVFYLHFAPSLFWLLLLPVHWTMGPIHGAIVNWCGHRYGYRNFDTEDDSRNTLRLELLTMGELFQNNHHQFPTRPNFAVRWFELDPAYQVMRLLAAVGIIQFAPTAKSSLTTPAAGAVA